jgi:hypothetical protein
MPNFNPQPYRLKSKKESKGNNLCDGLLCSAALFASGMQAFVP